MPTFKKFLVILFIFVVVAGIFLAMQPNEKPNLPQDSILRDGVLSIPADQGWEVQVDKGMVTISRPKNTKLGNGYHPAEQYIFWARELDVTDVYLHATTGEKGYKMDTVVAVWHFLR